MLNSSSLGVVNKDRSEEEDVGSGNQRELMLFERERIKRMNCCLFMSPLEEFI
ncbi:hypothetical protein LguiB_031661 [Lonicera macranthoides]